MKAYLAVVKTASGNIIKYQDFDTEAEANSHVLVHGGFIAQTPRTGNEDYWVVDEPNKKVSHDSETQVSNETRKGILREIQRLESAISSRRYRDAIAGTDDGWLENQEKLIAVERGKL
jgi:hypothetical protein